MNQRHATAAVALVAALAVGATIPAPASAHYSTRHAERAVKRELRPYYNGVVDADCSRRRRNWHCRWGAEDYYAGYDCYYRGTARVYHNRYGTYVALRQRSSECYDMGVDDDY